MILRSEEHTSELQSQFHLVCRLLLEKKKQTAHPLPVDLKKNIPEPHQRHQSAVVKRDCILFLLPRCIIPIVTVIDFVFFFNDTATTEIYTLSLHDALPI